MAPSIKYVCLLAAAASTLVGAHPAEVQVRGTPLTPGGKKAGSAGGRALPFWKDHLGWWYDWTPAPKSSSGVLGVSMLWGDGNNGQQDAKRFADFQKMSSVPQYLLGFNEPDCSGQDVSADMSIKDGYQDWNKYIAPKGQQGALLGSPAMCAQKDEAWLKRFNTKPLTKSWDFTAIHIYKPDMAGVQADIDYYWNTYQKPIWVTEFACVYDQNNFTPCSNQKQVNDWIRAAVDLFENNEHVKAYAYTDGGGLGSTWPPVNSDGSALSESGRVYLTAISKYG